MLDLQLLRKQLREASDRRQEALDLYSDTFGVELAEKEQELAKARWSFYLALRERNLVTELGPLTVCRILLEEAWINDWRESFERMFHYIDSKREEFLLTLRELNQECNVVSELKLVLQEIQQIVNHLIEREQQAMEAMEERKWRSPEFMPATFDRLRRHGHID